MHIFRKYVPKISKSSDPVTNIKYFVAEKLAILWVKWNMNYIYLLTPWSTQPPPTPPPPQTVCRQTSSARDPLEISTGEWAGNPRMASAGQERRWEGGGGGGIGG